MKDLFSRFPDAYVSTPNLRSLLTRQTSPQIPRMRISRGHDCAEPSRVRLTPSCWCLSPHDRPGVVSFSECVYIRLSNPPYYSFVAHNRSYPFPQRPSDGSCIESPKVQSETKEPRRGHNLRGYFACDARKMP